MGKKNNHHRRKKKRHDKIFTHQDKIYQLHKRPVEKSGTKECFFPQRSGNLTTNKLVLSTVDIQRSEEKRVEAKCYDGEENTLFPFISEKSLPLDRKNGSDEEANLLEAAESSCLENGNKTINLKANYLNRKRVDFVYPVSHENHSHHRLFFFPQYGYRDTDRSFRIHDNSDGNGTSLQSIKSIRTETKMVNKLTRIALDGPVPWLHEENEDQEPAKELSSMKELIAPCSNNLLHLESHVSTSHLKRQDQPYSSMGSLQLSYGATSVKDAVRDESGNRPRSNSTDVELKLPQRGLCEERAVLATHCWRSDLHESRGWLLTKLSQSRTPGMQNLVRFMPSSKVR